MADSKNPLFDLLKSCIEGDVDLFFRVFDDSIDLESEIPGFKKILVDGGICYGRLPLEWRDREFVPSSAGMAAIDRLAADGKISDEKTDPSQDEAAAVLAKAKAAGLI